MNGEKHIVPTAAHARPQRHRGRGSLATGLALILMGVLFLLDNMHVVRFHFFSDAWPLILVVFGVVRMIDAPDRSGGFWLVAIGLWLFVNEMELWGFTYHDSWPLLVVVGGLSMVWKALRSGTAPPASGGNQ